MTEAVAPQAAFWRGAELFDRGEFFEAHEAWEERWRATSDDRERLFLQGLIQVAAAFHKLFAAHALESAQRLLARGLEKLARVQASNELGTLNGTQPAGFDLAAFTLALRSCVAALARGELARNEVPSCARGRSHFLARER